MNSLNVKKSMVFSFLVLFFILLFPPFIPFINGQPSKDARVDSLIAAMRDKNPDVSEKAAKALAEEIGQPAVEPLIEALQDKNADVRKRAAYALGKIGDARAVEPLIEALKDKDPDVCNKAAFALGNFKDTRAVEPLIEALKENLSLAAWALGQIGDTRAVEPLIEALKDTIPVVHWNPAFALGNIHVNAAVALGLIGDTSAVEPLIEALQDKDPFVRECAVSALGKIGDARAVVPLIEALKSKPDYFVSDVFGNTDSETKEIIKRFISIREESAEALGKIGDDRAVIPLRETLEFPWLEIGDKNDREKWEDIREKAAKALAAIGQPGIKELSFALGSKGIWVSYYAKKALVEAGQPAVEPLIKALQDNDPDVRELAADALGKIGDARAVEPLRTALQDKKSSVRKTVAAALATIGQHAVEPLISAFNGDTTVIQGITFVSIPGGTFQMGQAGFDEHVHQVTVSAFQMGRYEITQEQYQAVVGNNPSNFKSDTKAPVEQMNWYDAVKFCNKLSEATGLQPCYDLSTWACDFTKNGYRLPTEAEWEYACRAGTTTKYYTGDGESVLAKAGWYEGNSGNTTHAVGGKQANAFGLYDMHGNVQEWCNDWYGRYSSKNATDPQGAPSEMYIGSIALGRIVRGGNWLSSGSNDYILFCRSAYRSSRNPGDRDNSVGFRVVRR